MTEIYHDFKPIISEKAKIIGRGYVRLGAFTVIEDYVLLETRLYPNSYISLGRRSKIKQGGILRTYDGWIEVGDRTTIGEYTIIDGHGGVTMGNCCGIAGHCYISAQNHITIDNEMIRFEGETAEGIKIGNDVLISSNVKIVDGVTIGDGCFIGAGSVVTRDLPPNTVCYGVPCRVIREREKPQWLSENMLGGE